MEQRVENGMCVGVNYPIKTGLLVVVFYVEKLVVHLTAQAAI